MFYYIDKSCTPSFPIGLVKTESDFFVRSVETGLGRWTMVVAVSSVDTYSFWIFSDLSCLSPWGYRNRCFLFAMPCLIVRRPNLEVAIKRLLHQQVKIQDSFSAIFVHRSASLQLFRWCGYFWGPWVSFVMTDELWQMSSQWSSQKLLQGLVSHGLTAYPSIFNLF